MDVTVDMTMEMTEAMSVNTSVNFECGRMEDTPKTALLHSLITPHSTH